MIREHLIMAATSDIAGMTRGKAFPASDLGRRLQRGIGWVPTNVQITCFDTIAETPFGSFGDLLLIPDPAAEAKVDFEDGTPPEHFILGDIVELDGTPWECCTRSILKAALARLERVAGLGVTAAFEHEFQLRDAASSPGQAFGLRDFEAHRALAETVMAALSACGLKPDTFLREYGPDQYEVTIGPESGVFAADAAVMVREMVRASARRLGHSATFVPIRDPESVGNGVHIHISLTSEGAPATHDPDGPGGLSTVAGAFIAGILKHLPALTALTAPSPISYTRLTPHRWSAAFNNLGLGDRESAVRICPVTAKDPATVARQFNFEIRAADAAASPHLALAALVHAGAQGIEDGLKTSEICTDDLSLLEPAALAARGYARLPQSLGEALNRFRADQTLRDWFGDTFSAIYLAHKQAELDYVSGKDLAEQCRLYETVW